MALACPQCGSGNVQKISLVRSSGITHVTAQHQSTGVGVGVGVGTGGIGVGVGTSKGTSQGIQQSAISKQLNEEFASPPKLVLNTVPFIRTGYQSVLVRFGVGLASFGIYNLVGSLTNDTNYPWLVDLAIFIVLLGSVIVGFGATGSAILLAHDILFNGKDDTPEIRQKINEAEKMNEDAIKRHQKKVSEFNELRDKGLYCHACGNKFLRK